MYFKFEQKERKKTIWVLYFLCWQRYLLCAEDGSFLFCFFLRRKAHNKFHTSWLYCPNGKHSVYHYWMLMTVLLLKFDTSFLKCVNRVVGFDALHSTSVEWNLATWFQTTCTRNKGCDGTYVNQKSTSLVRTQWFPVSPDFCKCFSSTKMLEN